MLDKNDALSVSRRACRCFGFFEVFSDIKRIFIYFNSC